MGGQWAKNEVTAAKRRCGMLIQKSDGSLAPRGTDFIDLDYVFICGVTAPHFALALGTMTNQRVPLALDDVIIESVNTGADTLETATAHSYETGDGPFVSDEIIGGSTPAGADIWIIVVDATNIAVASSLANAYSDTRISLSGTEDGMTISDTVDTQRGVDGHFIFEATQPETNHDAPETIVMVHSPDSADYDRDAGAGAYTTVEMRAASDDLGAAILENGLSRDDAWRIILRTAAAKFAKTGNDYQYRDMADSKDSHHGTVTSSGRVDADIDDAT